MSLYNDIFNREFIKNYFSAAEFPANSVILDLGCGSLPFKPYYKNRFSKLIAADAEKRTDEEIVLVDAQKLPFSDSSFDCVLLTEVLEHIPSPVNCIKEVSRVLKPGGKLLLTVPFMHYLHEIPHDYHRFSEFRLQEMLSGEGLAIDLFKRRGNYLVINFANFEYLTTWFQSIFGRSGLVKPIRRALSSISKVFFSAVYYPWIKYQLRTGNDLRIGDKLTGAGTLNGFVMGYCIVATKEAS